MCFKETPKTVDGLILLIEKCMETLDDFKDEHLENHYLLTSNYLMVHYKAWDQRRDYDIIPGMEQILKDLLSEAYAEFEELEKELKVGLITTHQLGNNLRRIWDEDGVDEAGKKSGSLPCLDIKDFPEFEGKPDDYYIDRCGNIYLATDLLSLGLGREGRMWLFACPIQPIGFVHPIMGILIPVPKKFRDQLNWNDPISKLHIINKEETEVRTYGCSLNLVSVDIPPKKSCFGFGADAAAQKHRVVVAEVDDDDDDDVDEVPVIMMMVDIGNDVEVVMYKDANGEFYSASTMESVGKAESWWASIREATVEERHGHELHSDMIDGRCRGQ
tara:strand:- start:505 stop:1494 length:990 start_codon:yes stop_codon:yes gene_type:complete